MRLRLALLCLACMAAVGCATGGASRGAAPSPTADTAGGAAATHAAAGSEPAARKDLYGEVARWVASGETEKAIAGFKELVAAHPKDLRTRVEFARYLLASHRSDEARGVLTSVLELAPGDVDALYTLALLEGTVGDTGKEQKILEEIVQKHPENAAANALLGQIYLSERQMERARASFEASLKADPENVTALVGNGQLLLEQGHPKEALTDLDRAIQLEPSSSSAYSERAEAKVELDDPKGADQDLTKAIALEPDYYWHYIDRGKLRLTMENDRAGALSDFTKAIEIQPDYFLGYVYRAGLLDEENKTNEALRDYAKLLALRPDYYFAYRPYALLLYMQKDWARAEKYFIKAYVAQPEDHGPQLLAAICMLKQGKKSEARSYLISILPTIPQDSLFFAYDRLLLNPSTESEFVYRVQSEKKPEIQARFQFYLGCYYELRGLPQVAERYFLDVDGHDFPGMYEYRLSRWELSQLGEGR